MDIDERKILERVVRLSEENNEILRKMQSRARMSFAFRLLYWIVIVGLGIGAFYFIQPYIESVGGGVGQLQDDVGMFKSLVN